jgi:hypothetical protein
MTPSGIKTHDLPACIAVPEPTAPTRTPKKIKDSRNFIWQRDVERLKTDRPKLLAGNSSETSQPYENLVNTSAVEIIGHDISYMNSDTQQPAKCNS